VVRESKFITMNDIRNKEDIKVFVNAFYTKVQKDDLIGPIFASKIADGSWDKHLERMYSFWNTVLLPEQDYRGNAFSKHADLPIQKPHFERWIALFSATIDENFEGEKADEAKMRAEKMGLLFQSKLAYIQANNGYKNIM